MKLAVVPGLLVVLLLTAPEVMDPPAPCASLPAKIPLKTATESFTHEYYVAVRDGKLWFKANEETTGKRECWRLLTANGLPPQPGLTGRLLHGYKAARSIREISTDGDNLIAVSDEGLIYYMKFSTFKWTDSWGLPCSIQLPLPECHKGWAISHRGLFAGGYEDVNGTFHSVTVGVTTLYVLSSDGLRINYADPWLPADYRHFVEGPQRGRFKAVAMSASASTLFVMNEAGESYTRLADFDTVGDDPLLGYSYAKNDSRQHALPGEDWRKQPAIPDGGRVTRNLTIVQTGKGNASRELRVEGVDADGNGGLYTKPIYATAWTFVRTGALVAGPFLRPELAGTEAVLGPCLDHDYEGTDGTNPARLEQFNRIGSPARLVLAGKVMTLYTRRIYMSDDGRTGQMRGMLISPDQAKLIDVMVYVDGNKVTLKNYPRAHWSSLQIELNRVP